MRVLRETWIVFSRAMRLSLRNPVWVVMGLAQPALYLVLLGPLLKPMTSLSGFPPGSAWQEFVPGLLVQLGMFGVMFAGFGLISEWRAGVIEAMRVTPASRTALLMGRVARDVVILLVQGSLLVLIGLLFGLRAPVAGVILALVMTAILGAASASFSYAVALITKNEQALSPLINGIAVPLLLLSGILLPMSLGPQWLRDISAGNPFEHVVTGLRALFRGDYVSADALWGIAVTVLIAVFGIAAGARTFQRESA
jgi:ABC-2 type transport system permease protein